MIVSPTNIREVVRASRNPPSVLGGIQLSGLPEPRANSSALFGLAPCGSAVSFLARNLRFCHHRTLTRISFLCRRQPSLTTHHWVAYLLGGRSFLCFRSDPPASSHRSYLEKFLFEVFHFYSLDIDWIVRISVLLEQFIIQFKECMPPLELVHNVKCEIIKA